MTKVRKLTTNAEPGTNFKSTVVLPYVKGLFKQIPASFNKAELDDGLKNEIYLVLYFTNLKIFSRLVFHLDKFLVLSVLNV